MFGNTYDLPGESAMDYEVQAAYDDPGAQTHIPIDAAYEVTDGEQWERERQEAHAARRTKTYPDVYVNGEDVTVTIDPYGKRGRHSTFEMRDDTMFWRHKAAEHRGKMKDHRAIMDALRTIDSEECVHSRGGVCIVGRHMKPAETYIPTTATIDKLDKLTPRCLASSTWGYRRMGSSDGAGVLYAGERGDEVKIDRWGKLPIVSSDFYKGALGDRLYVEQDLHYENAPLTYNRASNRAFDCGGYAEVCR